MDLPALMETYGLEAVVELGCGHAASLKAVLALPQPAVYFGCDIDPEAVRICKALAPQAIVAHADASRFLKQLLAPGSAFGLPTLWFVDAHSFAPGPEGFPLLEELELIAALKPDVDRDVIVIDDVRCIADEANPRYQPGECEPVYVRDEHSFGEYTMLFRHTHTVRVILDEEGYLVFAPRVTVAQRVRT